jgi:hypothetical protein
MMSAVPLLPPIRGVKICVTPVNTGILPPYFVLLPDTTDNLHLALEMHLLNQLFSRAPPFDHPFIVSLVLAVPEMISLDVLHIRVELCPCPLHRLNVLPPAVATSLIQTGMGIPAAAASRPSTSLQSASRPAPVSRPVPRPTIVPQPVQPASEPVPQQPAPAVSFNLLCDLCGRAHASPASLKMHMRVHAIPSFACTVCSKTYRSRPKLVIHLRNHTLPFVCACDSRFSSGSQLTKHQQLEKHSGGRIDPTVADKGCKWDSGAAAAQNGDDGDVDAPGDDEYVP